MASASSNFKQLQNGPIYTQIYVLFSVAKKKNFSRNGMQRMINKYAYKNCSYLIIALINMR